ncbi:MAG: hypothetical protein RR334_01890 [Clostridia bacterium]
MKTNNIVCYIGFAIKSSHCIFGIEDIIAKRKRKHLIIVSSSLAEKPLVKLKEFAVEYKIPLLITTQSLEDMVHKVGIKVIAITDKNLAEAILKNAGEEYKLEVNLID